MVLAASESHAKNGVPFGLYTGISSGSPAALHRLPHAKLS